MSAPDRVTGETPFTSHALTDVGRARRENQDNFFRGRTVFAVADGMGGHSHGEIASDMAVRPLEEIDGREWASAGEAEQGLVEAIRQANSAVVTRSASDRALRGMGTTLTAVMIREGRLHVAHVGDSRAYLFRPDEGMSQLTTDHTLVEQLVQEGRLSRDEIATHPQRSVITRAIGVEPTVQVDTLPPIALSPGDQILLCSDGLSGPVEDAEIAEILTRNPDGDSACRALVAQANGRGGPDNITVVLLRIGGAQADTPTVRAAAVDPVNGDNGELRTRRMDAEPPAGDGGRAVAGGPRTGVDTLDAPQSDAAAQARPAAEPVPAPAPGPGPGPAPGAPAAPAAAPSQPVTVPQMSPTAATAQPRGGLMTGVRVLVGLLGVLLLVGIAVGVGYLVLSRSTFLGVDGGEVAIFSGTNQEIAGLPLYRVIETTGVQLSDLPDRRQALVRAGVPVASVEEAQETLSRYEQEAVQENAPPRPLPSPTPSPSAPPAEPQVPADQAPQVPADQAPPAADPGQVPPADPAAPPV